MSQEPATLVDLLRSRCGTNPRAGFRFLANGEIDGDSESWDFGELDRRARAVAARLQALGLAGERALMLFPPGLDFIAGFFGCLYAGVVAVPAYPPEPARIAATLPRLRGIVRDARPAVLLTTALVEQLAQGLGALAPELGVLEVVAVDACEPEWADAWRAPQLAADSLAFLQYTSGSTGAPRGVMVSHRNLLENQRMFHGVTFVPGGLAVSWLPPYHDLGLIGTIIGPIFHDAPAVLFSPIDFLKQPLRWMRAIAGARASTSGGPDFAYALCARRARPEDVEGLDLSCWETAFTGAEPVRADTLRLFAEVFAPAGFDARAFLPGYGLAEATLGVTGVPFREGARSLDVDAAALDQGRVVPGPGRALVDCGPPFPCVEIALLRADGSAADPDEVGEIAVRGPAVARGYWERPDETRAVFDTPGPDGRTWLRTGDLGFLREGRLFIAGRKKDLIILRGRNHYPQDIEWTVERAHPALRSGCIAAFSIPLPDGGEGLGILAEVGDGDLEAVERAIAAAVARDHELRVDGLGLIAARALPKTSSGKIQRQAARRAWIEGALAPLRRVGAPAPCPEGLPAWLIDQLVRAARVPRERLRRDADLGALGLDSMALVELAGAMEQRLGVEVPIEVVFGRTLGALADWIEHTALPGALERGPDLEAAATLGRLAWGARAGGDEILLTGATGLLGASVLAELLARGPRRVLCLARGDSDDAIRGRILAAAARLGRALDPARFEVVRGDLGAPRLGLSADEFVALAARVERIVHCGATIDWSARFEALRATNIGGTIELVRLSAAAGGAPLHHVSSLGVFPIGLSRRVRFAEDEDLSEGELLRIPYFQSKWAAERALEHARAAGLPITIYRPGLIAGHSRTGAELRPAEQLHFAFIAGVTRMGVVPAVEKMIDLLPVDFVAAAVAALSLRDDLAGRRFNLRNPRPILQSAFYAALRARGHHLAPVQYPQWRDRLLRLSREDPDNPLTRFTLYYRTITPQVMRRLEATLAEQVPIDDAGARAALAAADLGDPPPVADLLETYLDAYRAQGLLGAAGAP